MKCLRIIAVVAPFRENEEKNGMLTVKELVIRWHFVKIKNIFYLEEKDALFVVDKNMIFNLTKKNIETINSQVRSNIK